MGRGRGRRSSYNGFQRSGRSRSVPGNNYYGPQRRGRRGNAKQYGHLKGLTLEDIALGHAGGRVIKVSSQSSPQTVAGAICHCLRIGGVPPAVVAKGTTAINQAIKAIAIARSFLEDDKEKADLIAQPSYHEKTSSCLIHLRRAAPLKLDKDASNAFAVTKKTSPFKLAGAICAKVRNKERCSLSAVGPACVLNAVRSLSASRTYLRDERIDIKFIPQFQKVSVGDRGAMSGMYFACLPRRV